MIFLPELESVERFDPFLYYPAACHRFYGATRNRKFLAWYYEYMKNSLVFLRDNYTNARGLLLMGGSNADMHGAMQDGAITDGSPFGVMGRNQLPAYGALSAMAHFARVLKKPDDLAMWLNWRTRLKTAIDEQLWGSNHYLFVARDPTPLVHNGTLDIYADTWAAIFGLADLDQIRTIVNHLPYTGMAFPTIHPPRYHGSQTGTRGWKNVPDKYSTKYLDDHLGYYANFHNGAMYVNTLGKLAAMAAMAGDKLTMERVFDSYERVVTRLKAFPIAVNPWTLRSGVFRYNDFAHQVESAVAIVQMLTQGQAGIHYQGENVAFRPLMTEHTGGSIEMKGFLWGSSRFDINVKGLGAGLARLQVDGIDVPSELVPATFHDGKRHRIDVVPGPAAGPHDGREIRGICPWRLVSIRRVAGRAGPRAQGPVPVAVGLQHAR